MRRLRLIFLLCFVTTCATLLNGAPWRKTTEELKPLPATPVAGQYLEEVKVDGYTRSAYVHVPKGYRVGTRPPLVLVLHGAGGSGRVMLDRDGWVAKADREGFIAVAPNGLPALPRQEPNFLNNPPLWNSGQLRARSPRARIDDVAFIEKLLDDLKKKVPYDPKRVYCVGHSNGAGMTYRLANELSERLAAIAVVAGEVAIAQPHPKVPMPTLAIFGKQDKVFPFNGGKSQLPWGSRTTKPVATYLAAWAKGLGCKTTPKTLSKKDGIERLEYPSETQGPALSVIYIDGHGHYWPGSPGRLPKQLVGPVSQKLNATDEIWTFFEKAKGKASGPKN